ncbi:MAG: glycosyltransferase family 2 protein [Pirellulaceae bacterium]
MLNIVVPMAGLGSRFAEAGYRDPKPLIPVHGIPMIEVVINNLRPQVPHRFIFICQQQHQRQYNIWTWIKSMEPACEVILLDGMTEGAACTVLSARKHIDNSQPLMIANCDQWVNHSINDYLAAFDTHKFAGFIMTMRANSPKWSYVKRDLTKRVCAVVEKQVVSDEATVGIYNFAAGRDFVAAADAMIAANIRVNNEFYVAPTYTQLAESGKAIGTFSVGTDTEGMYGLGTPADLDRFLTCGFQTRLQQERRTVRRAA